MSKLPYDEEHYEIEEPQLLEVPLKQRSVPPPPFEGPLPIIPSWPKAPPLLN